MRWSGFGRGIRFPRRLLGAPAGIKSVRHCVGVAFATGAVKRGFDMIMPAGDLACMIAGAKAQFEELKTKMAWGE